MERIHVFYSGIVQGVGFRFTAERIALELGIKGWVRNLSNGGVEIVAEGSKEKLNEFLSRIRNGILKRYIQDVDVRWDKARGNFEDFQIRFW